LDGVEYNGTDTAEVMLLYGTKQNLDTTHTATAGISTPPTTGNSTLQ